jgi:hypothetical protein
MKSRLRSLLAKRFTPRTPTRFLLCVNGMEWSQANGTRHFKAKGDT